MNPLPRYDVTRIVLVVLFIGAPILASFWVLRPFLAPAIWATRIVVVLAVAYTLLDDWTRTAPSPGPAAGDAAAAAHGRMQP
jgi:predicted PurR-regulated permease PerM